MKSILRITLAVAALQILAAPPAAGLGAGSGASFTERAKGAGTKHVNGGGTAARAGRALVPRTAARRASQAAGRRGGRARADALLPGVWGGEHVRLEVTEGGANVEFDCAHATVRGPVVVGAAGRFSVAATYFEEHGGPVRAEESSASGFPVRLTGRVGGSLMKLTVTRARTRRVIGTFSLARDREAELVKCR